MSFALNARDFQFLDALDRRGLLRPDGKVLLAIFQYQQSNEHPPAVWDIESSTGLPRNKIVASLYSLQFGGDIRGRRTQYRNGWFATVYEINPER